MKYLKLSYNNGSYTFSGGNSEDMDILGCFLTSDVRCDTSLYLKPTWQDWSFDDSEGTCLSGNITYLEKDDDFIFLEDLYSEEKIPTRLKMSRQQFVQLLNDWQEKVCKPKPKEVIVKYKNGQFIIETKD